MPKAPRLPEAGRWLWTCRAGFEPHLFEELGWKKLEAEAVAPGLVSSKAPKEREAPPWFARAGFRVERVVEGEGAIGTEVVEAAREVITQRLGAEPSLVLLHVWASDTDQGNALSDEVREVTDALRAAFGESVVDSFEAARDRGARILQVALIAPEIAAIGLQHPSDALSPAPGGRHRMWRDSSTSRAAMKLEEALESLPTAPGRGEVCVDLGAAPGGWTERLLARGARVIAVDPANLAPELMKHPKLRHMKDSAFAYEPEEPADWLFCDMAWRPLEVAQLLAKWGRKGWASQLVANIKLPMNDKNPILHRVRFILEQHGGWKQLKIRQLYHDRDEVTVTAIR